MAPNLKVDIEWLRKDANLWVDSGQTLAGMANTAGGAKIRSTFGSPPVGEMAYDPYTLIQDFLDAYNKFCDTFEQRTKKGQEAMNAMATTLVGVANVFESSDIPR
jgi:hypothetical protein